MINDFAKYCPSSKLGDLCRPLIEQAKISLLLNNRNIHKWEKALKHMQSQAKGSLTYQRPYLNIDSTNTDKNQLKSDLQQFMPWRKGPYQIGNLQLNSEWRGDMKWHRLDSQIKSLQGKTVLDVGAGNGYFSYLMAIAGAEIVLGIEPFLLFNYQYQAIRSLINNPPNAFVLPLRLEQMPDTNVFDGVFSMGVLYHQKDPITHLRQLNNKLANDGELVLETLIIDPQHGTHIVPKGRYAKMRNVWCLPTIETLKIWLFDAGFGHIKLADVTQTTTKEQQSTDWVGNNAQSLKDFLDPHNPNLTIEGLPAPKRAIFICSKTV